MAKHCLTCIYLVVSWFQFDYFLIPWTTSGVQSLVLLFFFYFLHSLISLFCYEIDSVVLDLAYRLVTNGCPSNVSLSPFFIQRWLDLCNIPYLFRMRSFESFFAFICVRKFHSSVRGFHPVNVWYLCSPNRLLLSCLQVGCFAGPRGSVQILWLGHCCICINVSPVLASKWLAFGFCWSASQTMKW